MNTFKNIARRLALGSLALFLGSASSFAYDTYTIFFASGGQVVRNGGLIAPPAGACGIRVTSLDAYEWRQTYGYPSNGSVVSGSNNPGFSNILVEMTFLGTCSEYDQDAVVVFGGADQAPPGGANVIVAQGDGTWVDSQGNAIGGGGGGGGINLPDFDLVAERYMVDLVHVNRLVAQIEVSLRRTRLFPLYLPDSDVEGQLAEVRRLGDAADIAFAGLEVQQNRFATLLSKQSLGQFGDRINDLLVELQDSRVAAETSLQRSLNRVETALQNRSRALPGSVALDIATAGNRAGETKSLIGDATAQFSELQTLATTATSGQ